MMARGRERISVDIPVTVTTVLDSVPATVVDLTEDGALVTGTTFPVGAQVMLDLDGHSVFGRVIWTEIDRIGVRFPLPLCDGPLYDALDMARHTIDMPPPMRQIAAARGGFGRRSFD